MGNLIIQGGFRGGCVDQLSICFEHHATFCEKNEIDYQVRIAKWQHQREANWNKVLWIIEAIEMNRYDTILWMDADTLIVGDLQINNVLRHDKILGMVKHSRFDPEHWNSGLIFTRSNEVSLSFWKRIWDLGSFKNTPWQEQPWINRLVESGEYHHYFQPLSPRYNYQEGLMESVPDEDVIIKAWHGVENRSHFMRQHMESMNEIVL